MNRAAIIIALVALTVPMFLGLCWIVLEGVYFVIPAARDHLSYWQFVVGLLVFNFVVGSVARKARS